MSLVDFTMRVDRKHKSPRIDSYLRQPTFTDQVEEDKTKETREVSREVRGKPRVCSVLELK